MTGEENAPNRCEKDMRGGNRPGSHLVQDRAPGVCTTGPI